MLPHYLTHSYLSPAIRQTAVILMNQWQTCVTNAKCWACRLTDYCHYHRKSHFKKIRVAWMPGGSGIIDQPRYFNSKRRVAAFLHKIHRAWPLQLPCILWLVRCHNSTQSCWNMRWSKSCSWREFHSVRLCSSVSYQLKVHRGLQKNPGVN